MMKKSVANTVLLAALIGIFYLFMVYVAGMKTAESPKEQQTKNLLSWEETIIERSIACFTKD